MKPVEENLIDISESQLDKKLIDFSDLINDLENIPEKQRRLWKETYENALADRHNAFIMFQGLVKVVQSSPGTFSSSELAIHGKTLATFLEKMSKANDQLLRLSELIGKSTKSPDDGEPDWTKILNRS